MSKENFFAENPFIENADSLIDHPENWTKEDYYNAFLAVTLNYYNELINVLNLESTVIEKLGEEEGERFIDEATASSPVMDLDDEFVNTPDVKDRIRLLFNYIEKNFGGRDGPADITPLN